MAPNYHRQSIFDTLRRTAARHPDKLAVKHLDHRWTYSEFYTLALQIAQGLSSKGIAAGDRVAILSRNSAAFAAARYAIAATGAILVPVNFMLNGDGAAYILKHSGAKLLLVGPDEEALARQAATQCPEIEELFWMADFYGDATPAGFSPFHDLVASQLFAGDPALPPRAPAQFIYTSGTESAPKGAVLSHEAVIWQYGSCQIDAEIQEQDVTLHALPLYHCAQLDCFLGPSIQVGGSNIITGDTRPDNLLTLLSSEGITSFFAPPTVWISLLNSPLFDQVDLSGLKKGYYGASIMPVEIMKELLRRLPGIRLWNLYGQTEIAPVATILKPEDQLRKPGSAGKPVIHVETRLLDDDGSEVAIGEVGEVVHRSPQLMTEYFNAPEKTAAAFEGGWFHSGDLATMDEEGYITIVDRKKDMIKTGGENVSGREVEEAIYQLTGIEEVAVIGLPHPKWIEAVTAVVVTKKNSKLGEQAVIEHCRTHLAPFKVPQKIIFVPNLPRNPSGKILKRDLREEFAHSFNQKA